MAEEDEGLPQPIETEPIWGSDEPADDSILGL
jgi:hypothetical protein